MFNTSYCTPAKYRAVIRRTDPAKDEDIQDDIEAISRLVDKELNRSFALDETPTIRYFRTKYAGRVDAEAENPWRALRGEYDLDIIDIADATGIEIKVDINRDQTFSETLEASQYQLYPRNALTGPEPRPYTQVHRLDSVWLPDTEVSIEAIFGWPSVPKAIELAVAHMVGILRIESPRATSRITELEGVVRASDECQLILHRLKSAYERRHARY